MADSMHAAHIGGEKLLTSAAPVRLFSDGCLRLARFRACAQGNRAAIIASLRRVSLHGKLEQRVRGGSQQPTLMRQCQGFGSPPH